MGAVFELMVRIVGVLDRSRLCCGRRGVDKILGGVIQGLAELLVRDLGDLLLGSDLFLPESTSLNDVIEFPLLDGAPGPCDVLGGGAKFVCCEFPPYNGRV